MRCTQTIGLNDSARKYLAENALRSEVKVCPTCKHSSGGGIESEVYASAADSGMFDDGPELYSYRIKGGSVVREVVQAVPWSSGPCIFLCLENSDGIRMFEWPEDDIDNCG